jgi:hypothetical protein
MSFVPPIKGTPSGLSGAPTFRLILDRASLERVKRGLSIALQAESERLAIDLSQRGIRILSQLDAGVGHHFLATLWTNTKPVRRGDGSVEIEVMNSAESLTFHTRSNAPGSDNTYPIDGKSLLSILLNGAKPHTFGSRSGQPLQFPIVAGQRQSRFAGSAITSEGVVGASFVGSKPTDVLRTPHVNHPGVVGNRFMQTAKVRLESMVQAASAGIGNRVSARI